MTWLTLLLLFKIVFTAAFAVIPLLLSPSSRLQSVLGVERTAVAYLRLYGWALFALLVGYAGGIAEAERGSMPMGVMAMGITSNAGAAALMLGGSARGPSSVMPAVFGGIAVGLAFFACFPGIAMSHAF